MKKKITAAAFLFFSIGFLFGAAMFSKDTPQNKNQDVKSAISEVTPTQIKIASEIISPEKDLYEVVKVIDGDTISVDIDEKIETIRLIGIDSPESVDPRKPVQCFGKEASDKARQILIGKKVSLEYDPTQGDKDKYKRLLRYVFLEDGQNFNKLMIEEGFAYEYTYDAQYKYHTEFKAAEKKAREEKRGLWADNACSSSPTQEPQGQSRTVIPDNSGRFSCAGKTLCGEMTSCEEANYYLTNCGLERLDGDKDGVPCETLCR